VRFASALAVLFVVAVVSAAAQPTSDADVSARLKDLADNYLTRDRRETLKLVEPIVALPDLPVSQRVEALRIKGNAEIAVGSNDQAAATLPVRRIGQPEDVAEAILMLMTNPFTTGSTLFVDGGGSIA